MTKILKLPNLISEIDFYTPQQHFDRYYENFLQSHLGCCYQQIPWQELENHFRGKKTSRETRGRNKKYTTRTKIALMFLKLYTNMSDQDLFDRLHSDIHFQIFCNLYISPFERLENYKSISSARVELAKRGDWEGFQKILAKHWKKDLTQTNIALVDATCYETSMRYPTDAKLLWEATEWIYTHLTKICRQLKIRVPRSKYGEQKTKYLSYQKTRKKTDKKTKKRNKSLLYLLGKLIEQIDQIIAANTQKIDLKARFEKRLSIIKQVHTQQQSIAVGEKVTDRIVSIDKAYIRPIVRGKETKPVEFGAKINMVQIDNLNFIEHFNFNAFNEGIRLKQSIQFVEDYFGKCTHIAADAIYATNENRRYTHEKNITTSFVRKGKAGKYEDQRLTMQKSLSIVRATRMEGSFGNEKHNYNITKIRARSQLTEILWIYFGVHLANISKMITKLKSQNNIAKTA